MSLKVFLETMLNRRLNRNIGFFCKTQVKKLRIYRLRIKYRVHKSFSSQKKHRVFTFKKIDRYKRL